ncbi:hypothetical protein KKD80_02510, partial [Patescibacteria group bacterium]|nr:hypothetical protein [Patescibacteria group bacterium]
MGVRKGRTGRNGKEERFGDTGKEDREGRGRRTSVRAGGEGGAHPRGVRRHGLQGLRQRGRLARGGRQGRVLAQAEGRDPSLDERPVVGRRAGGVDRETDAAAAHGLGRANSGRRACSRGHVNIATRRATAVARSAGAEEDPDAVPSVAANASWS